MTVSALTEISKKKKKNICAACDGCNCNVWRSSTRATHTHTHTLSAVCTKIFTVIDFFFVAHEAGSARRLETSFGFPVRQSPLCRLVTEARPGCRNRWQFHMYVVQPTHSQNVQPQQWLGDCAHHSVITCCCVDTPAFSFPVPPHVSFHVQSGSSVYPHFFALPVINHIFKN